MHAPITDVFQPGFLITVDPPKVSVALDTAPQLGIKIEQMKFGTYKMVKSHWLHTVTQAGVYLADHPEKIAAGNTSIFRAANAGPLLCGDYAEDGWLPYGVAVTPTTLRVDFYNSLEPWKRGVIELGRDFNELYTTITVPNGGASSLLRLDNGLISGKALPERLGLSCRWELSIFRAAASDSGWFHRRKLTTGALNVRCCIGREDFDELYCYSLSGKSYNPQHLDDVDPNQAR